MCGRIELRTSIRRGGGNRAPQNLHPHQQGVHQRHDSVALRCRQDRDGHVRSSIITHSISFTRQASIIPVKAGYLVANCRCQLNRVRRAEAIARAQFGCPICQTHADGNPLDFWVGTGEGKNLLCEFLFLITIGLDQQLQQSHCRGHGGIVPSPDPVEQGRTL